MTQLLRIFSRILSVFTSKKLADDIVTPSERISRYFLQKKGRCSPSKKTVSYGAFLPPSNLRESVYRTTNIANAEIWKIGEEYVAKPLSIKLGKDKKIHGRADIAAVEIINRGLELSPDTTPHPLHANIVGWPEEKDEQKMLAVELANKASLHLR
jgi:hypothetical protein